MENFLVLFVFISLLFFGCGGQISDSPVTTELEIKQIVSEIDEDGDGIDDFLDIVESARSQIGVVTKYDTNYYSEAFPPEDRGSCADVIWRALQESGYDFKVMIDEDMALVPELYPQDSTPDPNINFRRVRNIRIFLDRHMESLTTEVIPGDIINLEKWQGGDIVTYAQIPGGLWHIAVISNERRVDGVPLLIHNYGSGVKEDDYLLNWPTEITGHYRFKFF
ncbi:DUF1287 domain-containing protein [Patescibacteria group bacterium]